MWVSEREWTRMEERVTELEKKQRRSDDNNGFLLMPFSSRQGAQDFYNPYSTMAHSYPVRDVVQKLLEHLGVSVFHHYGTPPHVEIRIQEKPDATK
jgi:hypothetical protein